MLLSLLGLLLKLSGRCSVSVSVLEFVVVLVSLVRTELVTRVKRTSVTLSTGSASEVVW